MLRKCELCHKRDARYVCQECGRQVCELCFNPDLWLCIECTDKLRTSTRFRRIETIPYEVGGVDNLMKVMILGFMIIFIGMILITLGSFLSGSISGGIIIFPFIPVPLIFGFGPQAALAIIVAAILMITLIILAIISRKLLSTTY